MNPRETEELSPLAPSAMEMAVSVLGLIHIVLFAGVVVLWARGRLEFPSGVADRLAALVLLICVPVLGPTLILRYHFRVSRTRLQAAA